MLGPSGSGKTVYLGSLFRELSIQGERGFFLGADNKARLLPVTPGKRRNCASHTNINADTHTNTQK